MVNENIVEAWCLLAFCLEISTALSSSKRAACMTEAWSLCTFFKISSCLSSSSVCSWPGIKYTHGMTIIKYAPE